MRTSRQAKILPVNEISELTQKEIRVSPLDAVRAPAWNAEAKLVVATENECEATGNALE